MQPSNVRGFTLIELLVVVVVLGVLATIAIPKFTAMKDRSFVATVTSDLKNVASHQEIYHSDHFTYASAVADLGMTLSGDVTVTINEGTSTGWAATATHTGLATRNCGIYYGDAAASGGAPATAPGMVECD